MPIQLPDGERLAALETEVRGIKSEVGEVKEMVRDVATDLKEFAACKADKQDVDAVRLQQEQHSQSINRITGALVLISVTLPVVVTIVLFVISAWLKSN